MYILINPNAPKVHQEIKRFEAGCYTDALLKALEHLGYVLEATEDKEKEMVLSHSSVVVENTKVLEEKPIPMVIQKRCPFNGKSLEIFNLISTKPHTIAELVEKTKVAPATATTAVRSLFRRNGYFVKEETQPGIDGIMYSIK
jgi:hypothetical protein